MGPFKKQRLLGLAGGGWVGGVDDDLAVRAEADAFGADAGEGLQGEMDDAAFAGVHGIELEGLLGGLNAFGGGASHHFKFFDAEGAVAGAVEEDFVLEGRFEAESAMGEMFDGLEKFGAAFEEEFGVAAGKFGEDFGAAVVGGGAFGERADGGLQGEFAGGDGVIEEFLQGGDGRRTIEVVIFDQV